MVQDERPIPSDAEVVRQFREGDSRVFQILVDRHLPSLLGFFRYIRVPEEMVDDMIQETFLRVYRHIDHYDVARSFSTWLTTIGRNVFYTESRKRGNARLPENQPQPQTESNLDHVIARETARELLDGLDEQSKYLIELRVFKDLSFAEISEITGDPLPTLRVRFHRILNRLRITAGRVKEHEQ